jgi:hypothetical protein
MDEKRLREIKDRCSAARPGPWKAMIEDRDHMSGSTFIKIGTGSDRQEDLHLVGEDKVVSDADYDFIAEARQDIPYLLNVIEQLSKR